MILLITRSLDTTMDRVIDLLEQRNVEFFRFNADRYPFHTKITWQLLGRQLTGVLEESGKSAKISDFCVAWYRRMSRPHVSPTIINDDERGFAESQSSEALVGFFQTLQVRWVNRPSAVKIANDKMLQLIKASSMGMTVPPTIITSDPDEARYFYQQNAGEIITKVLTLPPNVEKQGTVFTNPVTQEHLKLFDAIRLAPVLLQRNIFKKYEVRVTVVGERVFAVAINSQASLDTIHDWRRLAFQSTPVHHEIINLPVNVERFCIEFMKAMELQYSAMDFIVTPQDEYVFLESNPSGQWLWLEMLTGVPITEALVDHLIG